MHISLTVNLIKSMILALIILAAGLAFAMPVSAQDIPDGCPGTPGFNQIQRPDNCPPPGSRPPLNEAQDPNACTTPNCERFSKRLLDVANILAALVGVVVTGSIIVAGIQYTMAADNAQKLHDSKARIRNALIALLSYIFLYAFLQWLIPGGVFN